MKKVSNKSCFITRGKQNYANIFRPKANFQGYFKVKFCLLNENLYFSLFILNVQKNLNNFLKNYFFIGHQINKIVYQLNRFQQKS